MTIDRSQADNEPYSGPQAPTRSELLAVADALASVVSIGAALASAASYLRYVCEHAANAVRDMAHAAESELGSQPDADLRDGGS